MVWRPGRPFSCFGRSAVAVLLVLLWCEVRRAAVLVK